MKIVNPLAVQLLIATKPDTWVDTEGVMAPLIEVRSATRSVLAEIVGALSAACGTLVIEPSDGAIAVATTILANTGLIELKSEPPVPPLACERTFWRLTDAGERSREALLELKHNGLLAA